MRPISTPDLDFLLDEPRFVHHLRLLLQDPDGVETDVSTLLGNDWLISATYGTTIENVVSGTITLLRNSTDTIVPQSMMPLIVGSPINRNSSNVYAPFLDAKRTFSLFGAVTSPNEIPSSGDWKHLISGYVDNIDTSGLQDDTIVISVRDKTALMIDTQIEELRQYGSELGTPIVDVLNQILEDNGIDETVTVLTPIDWQLLPFEQALGNVYESLKALVQRIGYDLRYMHDPDTDEYVFALYAPDRDVSATQCTIGPDNYTNVDRFTIATGDIRNVVRVEFFNVDTDSSDFVEVEDAASIARFGRQFMRIALAADDNINTEAEALRLANSALSDLAYPVLTEQITMPFFWPVQLADYYLFEANGVHYDTNQERAIAGFTHSFQDGSAITTLQIRGRPAGYYRSWLVLANGGSTPVPEFPSMMPSIDASDEATVSWEIDAALSGTDVRLVSISGDSTLLAGPSIGTFAPAGTVWQFSRPSSGAASALFEAIAPNSRNEFLAVSIEGQGIATAGLIMSVTLIAQAALTQQYRVRVIDPYPQGSNSVTVVHEANYTANISPGNPQTLTPTDNFITTGFIDYTIDRPIPGRSGQVIFTATANDRSQVKFPLDIVPFNPIETTGTTYFRAVFNQLPDLWFQGEAGTLSLQQGQGETTGSYVLRISGSKALAFPVSLVFDPTKFYRLQMRYKLVSADTVDALVSTSSGVLAFDSEGDPTNANSGAQIVCAVHNMGVADEGEWYTATSYVQGLDTVANPTRAPSSDPRLPRNLDIGTTQIRPFISANARGDLSPSDAVLDIDYFVIDEYEPEQARRLFGAITDGGNIAPGIGQEDSDGSRVRILSRGHLQGIVSDGATITFPPGVEFINPPVIRFGPEGMTVNPGGDWFEIGTATPATFNPALPVYRLMQSLNAGPSGFTARLKLQQKGSVVNYSYAFPGTPSSTDPVVSAALAQAPSADDTYVIEYSIDVAASAERPYNPPQRNTHTVTIAIDVDRTGTGTWITVHTQSYSASSGEQGQARTEYYHNRTQTVTMSGVTSSGRFRIRKVSDSNSNPTLGFGSSLWLGIDASFNVMTGGIETSMTPDADDVISWEAIEVGAS